MDKTISPEMEHEEKMLLASLGDMHGEQELHSLLLTYYCGANRFQAGLDSENYFETAWAAGLMERIKKALLAREASFFRTMADMMPLADLKGARDGVSPVARWMLIFMEWKKTADSFPMNPWYRRMIEESFPAGWPEQGPTTAEIHAALSRQGIKADTKTIREAAGRIGFPVRKAPLGAPKKKMAK